MTSKNILISGSYGTGNVGDEIILEVILSHLKKYNVKVMSQGPSYTEKYFKVPTVPTPDCYTFKRMIKALLKGRFLYAFNTLRFIKELYQCDTFIMGGGGLLVGMIDSVLNYYLFQLRLAKLFKKKIIIFGVGVTTIRSDEQKKNLHETLKEGIDIISVRDEHSLKILNQNLINAELIPDHAFYLNLNNRIKNKESKLIGISLYHALSDENIWPMGKEIFETFKTRLIELICEYTKRGYTLALIPFGDKADLNFSKLFQEEVKEKTGILLDVIHSNNYQEVLENISKCRYTLTMRFHAGVTSLLMNIPSLCVDFQFKSQRLLEEMRLDKDLLVSIGDNINKRYENNSYNLISVMDEIINHEEEIMDKVIQYNLSQKEKYQEFINKKFIPFLEK